MNITIRYDYVREPGYGSYALRNNTTNATTLRFTCFFETDNPEDPTYISLVMGVDYGFSENNLEFTKEATVQCPDIKKVSYGVTLLQIPTISSAENPALAATPIEEVFFRHYYIDPDTSEKVYTSQVYPNLTPRPDEIVPIDPINEVLLDQNSGAYAPRIHGTLILGDYIYGTSRSATYPDRPTSMVKINKHDYTDRTAISFTITKEGKTWAISPLDDVTSHNHYIYAYGTEEFGTEPVIDRQHYIVQYNTITESYRLFCYNPFTFNMQCNIVADDEYLYVTAAPQIAGSSDLSKYRLSDFENEELPSVVLAGDSPDRVAYYNHASQGAAIDIGSPYGFNNKGTPHARHVDDTHIYLAYSSGATNSNLAEPDAPYAELHKINKETMTPDGWCFISTVTDDMTGNEEWVFMGVEQNYSDRYGYGKGAVFVNKSTMEPKFIPSLRHGEAVSSNSYASLIFGNYVFDLKNDGYLYILDLSRIEEWDEDTEPGEFTLGTYSYNTQAFDSSQYVHNELVLDSDTQTFYAFFWWLPTSDPNAPSGYASFQIPFFSFYYPPTLSISSETSDNSVSLFGNVTDNGGREITAKGFYLGTDTENLTDYPILVEAPFELVLEDLEPGVYYYRAYAVNDEGEGLSFTNSFTIEAPIHDNVIEGTVFFENNPSEGVTVYLIDITTDQIEGKVVTGEDGKYRFDDLEERRYLITGWKQDGDDFYRTISKVKLPTITQIN